MRYFVASAVFVTAATASLAQAWAQDMTVSIPEQVVTATRIPTPPADVPAGVTVITRAAIEANGYNSLQQALADVPGVYVSPTGGLGQQTSVFVRGTNSNHVLVLRDGMPVTDASDPTGAYNFGTDTLSDIERIEIIRGPMAAVYGSGAIGGVINLISRRGSQPGIHWEGDLAGGYPALVRGAVSASGVEGPIDFALTAETQSQTGYDALAHRQISYTGTPQGFRDRILTLNLGYTPVAGTRLSAFLRANVTDFGFNTLGTPTYDTSNSDGHTASLLGRIGGTTTLFNGALESSAYVGRLQDDRRYTEALAAADPNQGTFDDRYHSYRTDVQVNNTLHLDHLFTLPGLTATALTFGYEYTGDEAKVRTASDTGGFFYAQSALAYQSDHALYLGLQGTVLNRLVLTAQVRQDWVVNDTPTTWRAGAVYDLKEIATHLKFSYGTAFRAPSLYERYGVDSFGYVGNPALAPEEAQGWEAGFTTDLPAFEQAAFATVGATYFNQRVRNLIVGVFTPVDTAVNVASAHVNGVETEITLRPASWIDLRGSWTWLNTATDGQPAGQPTWLLRRPQHQFTAGVTLRPTPKLQFIATLIYTGATYDYLYDNTGNGLGYGPGQHGLLANVAATYAVRPQADLYVNAFNIANSRYEAVNGYQVPGTTVMAGVRVRL